MTAEILSIIAVVGLIAAAVYGGGWLLDRKNSLLSAPDPIEHFEGEP